jgi:hypothetical protein
MSCRMAQVLTLATVEASTTRPATISSTTGGGLAKRVGNIGATGYEAYTVW